MSATLPRRRYVSMWSFAQRPYIKRYLWESDRWLYPPDPRRGFNEWQYWHIVEPSGGIVPTNRERLVRDAWAYRKKKHEQPT